jgi:periplasmic divalent cation tolerance protein
MKDDILLVICTAPNSNEAERIAHLLIEKRLAACCNILPEISSIYCWQNKIEAEQETLILIKTVHKKYEQLEKEIKMAHSYSVPEIIAIPVTNQSQAYLDWVIACTTENI